MTDREIYEIACLMVKIKAWRAAGFSPIVPDVPPPVKAASVLSTPKPEKPDKTVATVQPPKPQKGRFTRAADCPDSAEDCKYCGERKRKVGKMSCGQPLCVKEQRRQAIKKNRPVVKRKEPPAAERPGACLDDDDYFPPPVVNSKAWGLQKNLGKSDFRPDK